MGIKPAPFINKVIICAVTLLAAGSFADAQLIINVGVHDLLPNLAGQTIDLFVENIGSTSVPVGGISLNVQVADSGPPSEAGFGSIDGPDITAVDLLTGTVFASNNTGATDAGSIPQFANWTTSTGTGSVSLGAATTTKLATITISTVGFTTPQTWDFRLLNTINGPTQYFDPLGVSIFPTITDGSISVVPEPVSGILVGSFLSGWLLLRTRKLKALPLEHSQ